MAFQIRRGLEADLPASPLDGELLYSTDTNKLYVGFGGTANAITSTGLSLTGLSVTDVGGDGSLTYNNTTGVFTYTGPSATEVRAHFSAGSGISITNGVIAASGTGYANSDVKTYLGTFDGNIIPDTDNVRSLGSASKMWKDIYVGPGSLYVNGQKVLEENSGNIVVSADLNQNLVLQTSGSGDIEIDPTGTGTVTIKGTLVIEAGANITSSDGNAIGFSNQIAVDSLTSKTTNSNLTLTGNGTGVVTVDDNLIVTGNLTISGTTTTVNTETISLADNIIDLNSNFTTGTPSENSGIRIMRGDSAAVQMRWNETTDKWEFTNDGTTYVEIPTSSGASLTSFSVTDAGGDGSLSYNSSTGVFTYVGPSASEVRSHFTAGTGISITNGDIATTITQYTDALARAAISAGTGISYNSTTGVISTSGGGGGGSVTISNKTGAYTVVAGDLGTIINCISGTFTVSLTAAATLGSGFNCWIWNTSTTSTDVITIDPNGTEKIDGLNTKILRRGEGYQIICDGTKWSAGDKKAMQLYAENAELTVNAINPQAVGDRSVAIGHNATANGLYSIAIGASTSAGGTSDFVAGDGSSTGGPGYSVAINGNALSTYSTAIGRNSAGERALTATGAGAMALGGSRASGTDSFAAAIANNTSSYGASGANSVAIGKLAKATDTQGLALGAYAYSTGMGAVAISSNLSSGDITTASGYYSIAIGSNFALASGSGSVALSHGRALEDGKFAFGWPYFSNANANECQTGMMVLKAVTTTTTPVVFSSNSGGASSNNQVILPNNSAFAFSALIVARQQASGGTQSAAWKIEGLIRREGSAATTTLVNSLTTVLDNTPGWTIAVSADTTNGGLAITATGAAATNIRWVATVKTSEVTY